MQFNLKRLSLTLVSYLQSLWLCLVCQHLEPTKKPKSKMYDNIKEMLIKNEGLVCQPYHCSAGKLTIGVGRNLEANGISEEEAMYLLQNDIQRVVDNLDKNWGVW